ncbi:hypothetical protein MKX01_025809 [Papaver californicum]|nr:hypothetical protein MKX01_025809 [Papaver californicum]
MRSNLANPNCFLNSPTCFPSLKCLKFKEASKNGNIIPLRKCMFSDQDVPSFLFESFEQKVRTPNVGCYSIIGAQPTIEIVAKENIVVDHEEGSKTEEIVEDPMVVPRRLMEEWTPQIIHELRVAFCGGWVGYFYYDIVRYLDKKKLPFLAALKDDRNPADIHLGFYDDVLASIVHVIHWVRLDRYSYVKGAYGDGMSRLEALESKVHDIDPPRLAAGSMNIQTPLFDSQIKTSSMLMKGYILAGDVFQIVLSKHFERQTFVIPFEVYNALRVVNSSPYMTYLEARGCILVASSPEILTCVKKREIVMRPLSGTIRRRTTAMEDKVAEKQLLANKNNVSKPGSVKVEKLMNIERYSHVIHISSTMRTRYVTGELLNDFTCGDALRVSLPVGTVSGAPKLIDKLEVTRRGPYNGGFGFVSLLGDMDIALALRIIVFQNKRKWVAHIQAGDGIVADSNPDDELPECENKATALVRAIELAESTFVDSY